jgi:hypothetical protein
MAMPAIADHLNKRMHHSDGGSGQLSLPKAGGNRLREEQIIGIENKRPLRRAMAECCVARSSEASIRLMSQQLNPAEAGGLPLQPEPHHFSAGVA